MVFRIAVLILVSLGLLLGIGIADSWGPACLDCHSPHYEEHGACTQCHRGDPRTDRKAIAHHGLIRARFAHFSLADSELPKRGQQRLDDAGCRRCHVSGGKGTRLASDLDRVARTVPPEELAKAISEPAIFMPDFHFSELQIVELVNGLLAGMERAIPQPGEVPRVVHFASEASGENPFEKYCGSCHRLMSRKLGGLGAGEVGPNLSGLFSAYYPREFREGEPWRRDNLEKWVKNPRSTAPDAVMMPIRIKEEELWNLLRFFEVEAEGNTSGPGR